MAAAAGSSEKKEWAGGEVLFCGATDYAMVGRGGGKPKKGEPPVHIITSMSLSKSSAITQIVSEAAVFCCGLVRGRQLAPAAHTVNAISGSFVLYRMTLAEPYTGTFLCRRTPIASTSTPTSCRRRG